MPAVLYLSGHSESSRAHYQAHLRRFAQLGFVALAIDPIHLGELEGYHHGLFREGWWHWYSRGYTPAGVELFNASGPSISCSPFPTWMATGLASQASLVVAHRAGGLLPEMNVSRASHRCARPARCQPNHRPHD